MQQCRYQLSAMLSISSENLIVQSQLIFININVLTFILLQIDFLLLCTEDDNSCYRNVCKMSVVSFALAVVFICKLCLQIYFCCTCIYINLIYHGQLVST